MQINKITHGFVIQVYDDETGKWICQNFVAGDQVEIEAESCGITEPIDCDLPYLPFDMVQPENQNEEVVEWHIDT